jgi:hypothetical protein
MSFINDQTHSYRFGSTTSELVDKCNKILKKRIFRTKGRKLSTSLVLLLVVSGIVAQPVPKRVTLRLYSPDGSVKKVVLPDRDPESDESTWKWKRVDSDCISFEKPGTKSWTTFCGIYKISRK